MLSIDLDKILDEDTAVPFAVGVAAVRLVQAYQPSPRGERNG